MRKRAVRLTAYVILSSACALWIVGHIAQSLSHYKHLHLSSIDHDKDTSQGTDGLRIILFMTPRHFKGPPLWLPGATEMGNPFVTKHCPYSDCLVTSNTAYADEASLLVLKGPYDNDKCCNKTLKGVSCVTYGSRFVELPVSSSKNAFIFYQMEAPLRSSRKCLIPLDDVVNYTWTYTSDSDVQADYGGYYKLVDTGARPSVTQASSRADRNVLWYVSNCDLTPESKRRMEYVSELRRHIDVDIYGRCSNASDPCPTRDSNCVAEFRRRYRFYVAFENSRCDEYITEKFFRALRDGNVPIVRGLPRSQYEKLAPPHSFIHADDFESPQQLADYLRRLAASPDEYDAYHAWRASYGVRTDTSDDCKLCELATLRPAKQVRVSDWWSADRNCRLSNGGGESDSQGEAMAIDVDSRKP